MNGIFNAILYIIDENLIIHFPFKYILEIIFCIVILRFKPCTIYFYIKVFNFW
ncbi:hypothetical protein C7427_101203 [Pantoea ananatis]|nr:hypothetical protein C7427_101203 [Pantoea ananatis]